MMYRVRRVQIGNSGEIAWESKRAEIIPWPVELTVGGLYALRSGRLYRVEGRENVEQKVDPYMREAPWVCCPMCDEDVCVGRFNCPENAEWCREKREKDAAEGVVRV